MILSYYKYQAIVAIIIPPLLWYFIMILSYNSYHFSRNAPKFYFLFTKSLEARFLLFMLISRDDILFIESDWDWFPRFGADHSES